MKNTKSIVRNIWRTVNRIISINHEIIIAFVCSLLVFIIAIYLNNITTEIMSVATYLTWHNLFEFTSILASFSIFIVTYYVHEESLSTRMIILGCAFFAMGALDTFHTLSFKGMVDFFIQNNDANRATTFWVASRLIGSIGILVAVFIPIKIKSTTKRFSFVGFTFTIVSTLFLVITYYPKILPIMFLEGHGLTSEKIYTEYFIVLLMAITYIKLSYEYYRSNLRQDFQFMLGILFCIFSEIAFISYASVYDIYNYLGHIYKFIAYFVLFKAIYSENVKIPYREMKRAKNELKAYAENLDYLVKQRTKELEEINGKLLLDLDCAKDIQRSLLPTKMPEDVMVSFEVGYFPAEHLSGDFYNVIKLDDDNIAIYFGDVAGHGVSAAMLTLFANQNLKSLKDTENSMQIVPPKKVLGNLYTAYNLTNFKEESYLVMIYGIYNSKTKTFTYASAGLNVSPIIIKKSGEILELDAKGFAICKLGDIITPFFQDKMLQLDTGDKILFYTDGLIEVENPDGDKYSYEKLINIIRVNSSLNTPSLAKIIENDFLKFANSKTKLKDDVTFMTMEVH